MDGPQRVPHERCNTFLNITRTFVIHRSFEHGPRTYHLWVPTAYSGAHPSSNIENLTPTALTTHVYHATLIVSTLLALIRAHISGGLLSLSSLVRHGFSPKLLQRTAIHVEDQYQATSLNFRKNWHSELQKCWMSSHLNTRVLFGLETYPCPAPPPCCIVDWTHQPYTGEDRYLLSKFTLSSTLCMLMSGLISLDEPNITAAFLRCI